MAKAKSKKITIEEALVPVDEKPYEIPENWCWVELGKITSVQSGGTPSTSHDEYYEGGDIPWISPADLSGYNDIYISNGNKFITKLGLEKSSAKLLPKDTVCLSSRAPIGYVAIAANALCTNQGFKSYLPSKSFNPRYLYWYLKANKDMLESMASGTTFLELSGTKAGQVVFPIAPLAEQQRIVEQIESLFSKLDEAKEKAHQALDEFEIRRASILHSAFIGELTKKWRMDKGCADSEWNTIKLSDLCKSIKYGTSKKSVAEGEVAVLRMGNMQHGEIDWTNLAYSEDEEDNKKYNLIPGDVLFNRTNSAEWVGKVSIYRGEMPAIYAGYIIKLDYDRKIMNGEYLNYILNSPEENEYCKMVKTDGVNQSNINSKKIGAFEVPIPSMEEQLETVRIINELLEKEDHAKTLVETIIEQINTMKKSILAKAFRGELGTNNPEEESSVELLKRVLET